MKRLHIAIASMVLLGILVLVTVAYGIGGVAAAEDDRFRIKGTTLTKYLGTDTFVSVPDTVSSIGDEAFSGNGNTHKYRNSQFCRTDSTMHLKTVQRSRA